ncbi:MAG: isoleucine--tRNA ligase [Candidatus Berkelbacteria bacterium]
MSFKKVDPQLNLPKLEEKILKFWDENKTFQKSLDIRKDAPRYTFYDGPPFATGTPHYGHIPSSLMKDAVPRYWTMKGKLVERKWGWDCHGLPIENIAEKELGIKTKKEIEEIGVDKFNEFCRSKVLGYVDEWKKVIRRMGRWADMDNAYKTMDLDYMESVWSVFKDLYDKDLIYEGYRSMHICPRCETTLSQSEVAEGYKDIKDLSVIAKFHLDAGQKFGDHETKDAAYILAWTTTPWTLIGNVALAVGADIKYSALRINGIKELLILASDRVEDVTKDNDIEIVHDDIKGSDLVGLKYQPLFDVDKNVKNAENGWCVVAADFVTTEDGTGVVHIAPAFGEDDMNLGKKLDLPFIQHVGMDGIIKPGYGEFSGLSVKPAEDVQSTDVAIIKYLAGKNLLFDKKQYEHSYPHCWRCDTPLINYATSSWFVAVEKVKTQALELAKDINWSPKHVKAGRFGMWLEGARDWSISRQRYWASVMPIWKCEKCNEIKVVGSVSQLEELSGEKVTDLHKHIVDKISFKCEKCNSEMKRIPDVLDTWFDSGSMPYAQMHYPFENKEKFENNFPADFIAEGVDQTRAWFYYLHILATATQHKPAFKNVIVNGIVLAEDGKKMSKRLQNYPDPMEMFNKYGADVMRMYFLTSPVVAAENLNFSESDMSEFSRGMFRMLWNSYYFFILYVTTDNWTPAENYKPGNLLDVWIVSKLETLNLEIEKNMQAYNLPGATRLFAEFIDELSNWYIRRSRKRFWKSENDDDKNAAYATLHYVLTKLSQLLAPFAPFVSEEIYQNLTGKESVHLSDFPVANKGFIKDDVIADMDLARKIVELGLSKRAEAAIKVRQPLMTIKYKAKQLSVELESIIASEVNVRSIYYDKEISDDIELDTQLSDDLILEGKAREFVRIVQGLRKKADFDISDRIETYYITEDQTLLSAISKELEYIKKETLSEKLEGKRNDSLDISEESKIDGVSIFIGARRTKT